MLKTWIYIICLSLLQLAASSQGKPFIKLANEKLLDSLKQNLAKATNDSSRINLMRDIGYLYEGLNLDSSLNYTQAGLALARQRDYGWGEVGLMTNMAGILRQQGKLAESLDLLFKALNIAEENKLYAEMPRAYRRLSTIYLDLENFSTAKEYLLKALKIDEASGLPVEIARDHLTLGNTYEKLNQLDSASFHIHLAYEQINLLQAEAQLIYQVLGNIEMKSKNNQKAIALLEQGFRIALKNIDFRTAAELCAGIAAGFMITGNHDSAFQYASTAFTVSEAVPYKKGLMLSGNLLAALYDSAKPVKAFNYFKIAAAAKDSLFGVGNLQTIQNLVSREEARQQALEQAQASFKNRLKLYALLTGLGALLIVAVILFRNNRQKQKDNLLLLQQKETIETTLSDLKSAQAQLIQSEKMASLGALTAGIAHEIQNPLNFVNNFAEVNKELIEELQAELKSGNTEEAIAISNDLKDNEEKIKHHGQRADSIVKGMLQHSRTSAAVTEPTDINKLTEEYLRLAYHGLRAKDKLFNATMKTDFDQSIGTINIIPQDIGRVMLNLFSNAFYAMNEKKRNAAANYEPAISVATKKSGSHIDITIEDNGNGIPPKIVDKILQPFFTTKPTGQGTGLGLSLAYDIVKAHGGELMFESNEGQGTKFLISLPDSAG